MNVMLINDINHILNMDSMLQIFHKGTCYGETKGLPLTYLSRTIDSTDYNKV